MCNKLMKNKNKIFTGFGGEYFGQERDDGESFVKDDSKKMFHQAYKSVLNSKTAEESLVIIVHINTFLITPTN